MLAVTEDERQCPDQQPDCPQSPVSVSADRSTWVTFQECLFASRHQVIMCPSCMET